MSGTDHSIEDSDQAIRFSILTATFNSASTLTRTFESLQEQTIRSFEWVIVDDGSTDGTQGLIESFRTVNRFEITYTKQENRGKPSAINAAVRLARGHLATVLDSDDVCLPNAVERFEDLWASIPSDVIDTFSGVSVNTIDRSGTVVGTPFPLDIIDDYPYRLQYWHGVQGEKWGFHRTDLLKAFPYPVYPGETYVPEGLVWNRLGTRFLVRHINEALRIYEPGPAGITSRIDRLRLENPRSFALFYGELAALDIPARHRLKAAGLHVRCRLMVPRNERERFGVAPWLRLSGWLLGIPLWALDQIRRRATGIP